MPPPEHKKRKLPKGVYEKQGTLWFSVYRNGEQFHRPAGTNLVLEAQAARDNFIAELVKGEIKAGGTGNVTCSALLDDYLNNVKRTSQKNSDWPYIAEKTVKKHLEPFFGPRKADKVDRKLLEKYHDQKVAEGYDGISVNRQLGILRTAFSIGRKNKRTNNTPDFSTTIIRRLERENARQGIITDEQYQKLASILPAHIKPLFVLCWKTGVRPAEAFRIRWNQVDFSKRLIALKAGETKTGPSRFLPMVKDVVEALQEWQTHLMRYQPKAVFVFTDPVEGCVMNNDYYKTPWATACREANYMVEGTNRKGKAVTKPALLFYDTRRSFRSYLPEEIAKSDGMAAMGHTQDTTYGRYHVDAERSALRVLDALDGGPSSKPNPTGLNEQIAGLFELQKAGALTESQYQAAVAKLLG
ncbi:MAG: tyrosine-type recombinase/integrase [Acidobacteria bacterium]|nr:tyrosine-type recombinase/integrase [Acidobacteriota bacterium]